MRPFLAGVLGFGMVFGAGCGSAPTPDAMMLRGTYVPNGPDGFAQITFIDDETTAW